jgi:hypothetical protein
MPPRVIYEAARAIRFCHPRLRVLVTRRSVSHRTVFSLMKLSYLSVLPVSTRFPFSARSGWYVLDMAIRAINELIASYLRSPHTVTRIILLV